MQGVGLRSNILVTPANLFKLLYPTFGLTGANYRSVSKRFFCAGTLSTASRGSRASRKGSDGERSVGEAISKPVESSKPPKKMGGSHTSSSNSALERSQKTAKGSSQSLKRRAGKIASDRRLTPEGNSIDVEEGEEQLSKRHRPLQESK